MKHFISFLILASGAVITACAPVYQCGNKPEKELLGSKRLKATVVQRDSLCNALDEQKSINAELNQDINELQEELSAEAASRTQLKKEFDQFIDQSSGEQAKLMKSLKQKEDELKDREKALNDMKAILARQDSITNRLNNILRNALLGFNSDELSVEIKNGKVYVSMSDKLLFKSGSADMEQKGQEALKALAGVLTKNPDIDVLVEGHTDSLPIKTALYKDNWDLSVARAASVVRLLTDTYSVNPKQVTPAGRGEFFPKADNSTPEGRAKNRRTEIILSPKLDEVMNLLNK